MLYSAASAGEPGCSLISSAAWVVLDLESEGSLAGIGHLSLICFADFKETLGLSKLGHHFSQLGRTLSDRAQLQARGYPLLVSSDSIHFYRNYFRVPGHEPF